jgi:hypothetical protein
MRSLLTALWASTGLALGWVSGDVRLTGAAGLNKDQYEADDGGQCADALPPRITHVMQELPADLDDPSE